MSSSTDIVDGDGADEIGESDCNNTVRSGATRYRGRIAYDGTGFSGWQFQPKGRTVQGELESVLSRRFNRTVRVVGAGRTDAGVHARGQAFHFDLYDGNNSTDLRNHHHNDTTLDLRTLQHAVNRMLRRDARVWDLAVVPNNSWHVIGDAERKLYSYRLCVGPAPDPLRRYARHHVHQHSRVNVTSLAAALRRFEGTHDFRAFSGAVEQNARKKGKTARTTDTVRTVYSCRLVEEDRHGNYRIDVLLQGALYKMVRNMVGTALDVCQGTLPEEELARLLRQGGDGSLFLDRACNPCKPAPPEGLTLEKVFYVDGF